MTYSIVARDPATGRFGIAIQSCWPFVGAGCPWVESGVGAVVTQSFTEVAHGPNGPVQIGVTMTSIFCSAIFSRTPGGCFSISASRTGQSPDP